MLVWNMPTADADAYGSDGKIPPRHALGHLIGQMPLSVRRRHVPVHFFFQKKNGARPHEFLIFQYMVPSSVPYPTASTPWSSLVPQPADALMTPFL